MPRHLFFLPLLVLVAVGCQAEKSTDTTATASEASSGSGPQPVAPVKKMIVPPPKTYGVGEQLHYELTWNSFSVGTLTINILPRVTMSGEPSWKFHLQASTNSFADSIYKVRMNLKSYVDNGRTCSLRYQSFSTEGSKTRSKRFDYDWKKMQVHYLKNGSEDRGWRPLPEKCFDPLAMFYALREMTIDDETKELTVWVSDGKKCLNSNAEVVRRERVKDANDTSYDTYLIEPDLKDLKGVFEKSDDAKLQLWVSNDKYRIPVKISSKVSIGSFTATLTKHVAHDK